MTVRYEITLRQFASLTRSAPKRYERAGKAAMRRAMPLLVRYVKQEISALDVVDTGEMRNSVEMDTKALQVGVTAPHGGFMEVGTRPHMPPIAPLVEWAKRKFSPNRKKPSGRRGKKTGRKKGQGERASEANRLVSGMLRGFNRKPKKPELTDKQATAIAWRVAMKIKKEGTKPRFYMRAAVRRLEPEIPAMIRKAMVKADMRAGKRAAGKTAAKN